VKSMEKENIRGILGLSTAHFVTDIYSPVLPAILPLLILENGFPFFIAGLIYTVFNLTSSVTQPVIGWFYDKYGMAVPVYFTVLISAFFISFIGFLNNYYLMLLFAACAALGPALRDCEQAFSRGKPRSPDLVFCCWWQPWFCDWAYCCRCSCKKRRSARPLPYGDSCCAGIPVPVQDCTWK